MRAVLVACALAAPVPLAAQHGGDALNPFVSAHCVTCHGGDTVKGGLDLTTPASDAVAEAWRWHRLGERVRGGEMPPPDADAPPPAERAAFVAAVAVLLRDVVPTLPVDAGRVTVRRLSRSQWANSVRDLFGVDVATTSFPADDLGYGFDTIGDALTFSTLHLEHYLAGAGEVAAAVFHGEDPARPAVRRFEAETMNVLDGRGVDQNSDVANLFTRATVFADVPLPRAGSYLLRIVAGADQAGDEPAKMVVRVDDRELATIAVEERKPRTFEVRAELAGGARRIALAFVNDFYAKDHPDPKRRDRNLRIDALEVTGPLEPRATPPEQAWLAEALAARGEPPARLRALVKTLAARVWRRPATDAEQARLTDAAVAALGREEQREPGRGAQRERVLDGRAGEPWVHAQRLVLQALLASPHFLFRIEPAATAATAAAAPLPGGALATRLAYFVWASAPDAELLEAGARGRLAERASLLAQVDRLLADPRADRLATEFAALWLELRSLGDRTPDPARFPPLDDALRTSMRRETELLFTAVLREDRDVRTLLDADFTHVDARLAALYGWPAPAADAGFVRVPLPATERDRGGVLGHASILTVTSNPTRTSPVKRGKWILENLLGQAPPPPPPGNDSLPDEAKVDSTRSFREQLAMHRERGTCAGCHVRMDALGFALERFDAVGRHRVADAAGPIDSSGALPDGTQLDGIAALKRTLVADAAFARTLAEKLFVYAIGRDLRPVDRLRVHHAVGELQRGAAVTLRDLVRLVATDVAFTHQGGGGAK